MNPLKHYRKQAGLSQAQLAEQAGISPRTLQDYEQGQKPLEKAAAITVLTLARILGCTVEDLIGPSTAPAPFGYENKNGALVINEEEAAVIRKAAVEMLEKGAVSAETEREYQRLQKTHNARNLKG